MHGVHSNYKERSGLCVSRALPTLVKLLKYLTRNTNNYDFDTLFFFVRRYVLEKGLVIHFSRGSCGRGTDVSTLEIRRVRGLIPLG